MFILRIRNWDKFQHYKRMHSKYKKQMTWLKLYGGDILNDPEWFDLTDSNKAIYIELLCLASQFEGNLPPMKTITFRLRRSEDEVSNALKDLSHWIEQGVYTAYIPEEEKEKNKKRGSSKRFDDFWKSLLPNRRTKKVVCQEKWEIHNLDEKADLIIKWIKKMNLTKEWKEGYNPGPEVIINQKRWEDDVIRIDNYRGKTL